MTEVNHRRNGKRYGTRGQHYMRFWWAGRYGAYKNSGWDRDYKHACKRCLRRLVRRFENRAAKLLE